MRHDQHFKNLILDYPREALAFFAAEEAAVLDPSVRVVPLRQEQLQERLGERFRELDVPLRVEWPDGSRAALVFVIEEETEPGRFSIHRLAHYCLDIAELVSTDRVVPVVIFLRAGQAPRRLELAGERSSYLTFSYLACALAEEPAERHADSPNLVARVNLPNMAHSREARVPVYGAALRGLLTLEQDMDKQLKYLDFIDGYAALDDNERKRFEREYPQEAERVATFSERYIEQGRQKGIQQGLEQGLRRGEARLLLRLLTLKFGEPTPEQRARIEEADADTVLTWSERVLTAASIEEVLR